MDNKFFALPQTTQALSEMSATLAVLSAAVQNASRRGQTAAAAAQAEIAAKAEALENLRQSSATTLDSLTQIIAQIDNMLENNGTGNHHN